VLALIKRLGKSYALTKRSGRNYIDPQIQLTSATLTVVKKVNCGNLAVFLTDKSKRSTHEWLHTAYPKDNATKWKPFSRPAIIRQ
jgi:hypothetical protein